MAPNASTPQGPRYFAPSVLPQVKPQPQAAAAPPVAPPEASRSSSSRSSTASTRSTPGTTNHTAKLRSRPATRAIHPESRAAENPPRSRNDLSKEFTTKPRGTNNARGSRPSIRISPQIIYEYPRPSDPARVHHRTARVNRAPGP